MAHISIDIDMLIPEEISLLAISPNAKYVVTFSKDCDNEYRLILLAVNDHSGPLDNIDGIYKPIPHYTNNNIRKMELSDDKKIFINFDNIIKGPETNYLIYDVKTKSYIKLSPKIPYLYNSRFLSNGDFICLGEEQTYIYSTVTTKNNKWLCKKVIVHCEDEGIHRDKVYICDDYYMFLIDSITSEQSFPFGYKYKAKEIISNKKFTMILFDNNECVAYPNGSSIPIFKLVLNNIKLSTNRYIILFPYGNHTSADIFDPFTLRIYKNINLVDYKNFNELFTINKYMESKQKVFRVIDGKVWMINLSEFEHYLDMAIANTFNNELIEFSGNIFESIKSHSLPNSKDEKKMLLELLLKKFEFTISGPPQQFKWAREDNKLCVYNNENERLTETGLSYLEHKIVAYLKENNICLMRDDFIIIYHYDDNDNKIETLHKWDIKFLDHAIRILNQENLSLKDFKNEMKDIFRMKENESYLGKIWIQFLINDNFLFSKYAETILHVAIDKHKGKIVKFVYEKCLQKYNEDPKWNIGYLEFMCQQLSYLRNYYPEYLINIYSEFEFVLNPYCEGIQYLSDSHLNAFYHTFESFNFTEYKLYDFCRKIYKYITKFNIIYVPAPTTPTLVFIVPFPKYVCYPKNYYWWSEIFKPKPSVFVKTINNEFYETWNGEAIVNFKWNAYGKYYYMGIWMSFMAFLGCFTIVSTSPPNEVSQKENLLIASVIFEVLHLFFEIRKIIWNPRKWILNTWNFFGLGSFAVPTAVALYWIITGIRNIPAVSISCLLLDIKFLLFFGVFESFGKYFTIVIGVAKTIISFLVILFMIIASFAHSFYILLQPTDSSMPNEKINMFATFRTSLLAMYYALIGDTESLKTFSPNENSTLAVLFVIFTFIIVIYLMNLFIGLLNIAIVENTHRSKYLAHKAEILAEIELFYMLPHQRRNRLWFPEMIKYYVKVDKVRKVVNNLIDEEKWIPGRISPIQERLLKILDMEFDETIET